MHKPCLVRLTRPSVVRVCRPPSCTCMQKYDGGAPNRVRMWPTCAQDHAHAKSYVTFPPFPQHTHTYTRTHLGYTPRGHLLEQRNIRRLPVQLALQQQKLLQLVQCCRREVLLCRACSTCKHEQHADSKRVFAATASLARPLLLALGPALLCPQHQRVECRQPKCVLHQFFYTLESL